MAVNLFFATVLLSVTGDIGYILLKLLSVTGGNRLSQNWRYHSIVAVSLLFVLPVYRLWTFIPMPHYALLPIVSINGSSESALLLVSPTGIGLLRSQPLSNVGIDWAVIIKWTAALWLWVAVGLVLWDVWGLLHYRRLIEQTSSKVSDHLYQCVLGEANLAGIRDEVCLLVSPLAQSPMLIGFFHPTILLPSEQVPGRDARFILAHELTHFRRKDLWKKLLVLMVRRVHWFNPIVYLLNQDFVYWLETSCDEHIVGFLDHNQRKEYGYILIDYAPTSRCTGSKLYVSFTSCRYKLKRRISSMLNTNKNPRTLLSLVLAIVLVVGCLATTALAANIGNSPETISGITYSLNDMSEASIITQRLEEPVAMSAVEEAEEYSAMIDVSTFLPFAGIDGGEHNGRMHEPLTLTVPAYTGMVSAGNLNMEVGQTILVNFAVSPASENVKVGIVDSTGYFRYVRATNGSVNHSFYISTRGTYHFCVENGSGNEVSLYGYENY